MILLPPPETPKEAIPHGFKLITFENIIIPHPWIIGAVTNMQIIIEDDPEKEAAFEEIGRTAFATGASFRDSLQQLMEETDPRPTTRTPEEEAEFQNRLDAAIDRTWWDTTDAPKPLD